MTLTCIIVTKHRKWCILSDVSDTIHADSLALFALNIEFLLVDVTKPEKSKILTLNCGQVFPGQIFYLVQVAHVQGYRMAFETWKSVQKFGRSQKGPSPPPQVVLLTRLQLGEG